MTRQYIMPQEDQFGRLLLTLDQINRIDKMFNMYDNKVIDREQLFLKIIEIVIVKPDDKKEGTNLGANGVIPTT